MAPPPRPPWAFDSNTGERIAGHQRAWPVVVRRWSTRVALAAVLVVSTVVHLSVGERLYRPRAPAPNPSLACISYDPRYRFGALEAPELKAGVQVREEWIAEDLALVAKVARCVRTYSLTDGMEKVPELANRLSMDVVVGLDITTDVERNIRSVEKAVELTRSLSNITSFIVGNEVLYHNRMQDHEFVPPDELYARIADLRERVTVPVSTAEPLPTWDEVRDLAGKLDFIALNNSPYWAAVHVDESIDYLENATEHLRWLYPEKPMFISEVGWPAGGPTHGSAVPGRAQADQFLASFVTWATAQRIAYNYFEAFDQPWKRSQLEGRVGSQWGLFDSSARYKLGPLEGQQAETPIRLPGASDALAPWSQFSALAGFVCCLALLLRRWKPVPASSNGVGLAGGLYIIGFAQLLVTVLVLAAHAAHQEYFLQSWSFWCAVAAPMAVFAAIVVARLLETAETLSMHASVEANSSIWRRAKDLNYEDASTAPRSSPSSSPSPSPTARADADLPLVSIHVPCSREPPAMVIQTLEALLALQYPSFEVIVVDNNTLDPSLYEPVAAFCAKHSQIRFFHEDVLAGYKAGALNYALERTSPLATIVAVVDADYLVDPLWLAEMVPWFADPAVAVVQAPQAYRAWERSLFATMIRSEYEGFFQIAMVQRAARNAIIQHGTMLLLRRQVVEAVGQWAEWCITEDTELGLRILRAGHRAVYVSTVYGKGLLPQTSTAYFKQRFRWVAGAMTILRRHGTELLGLRAGLTRAQRYHFLTGWLPWIADAVVPLFTATAAVGVFFCLHSDLFFPPIEFAYPFMFYMAFQLVTGMVSYRARVHIGWFNSTLASVAGMSMTWVVAAATVRGLLARNLVFVRTEKSLAGRGSAAVKDGAASWPWSIVGEGASVAVACGLFAGGGALLLKYGLKNPEALVWTVAIWLFILPPACCALLHAASRHQRTGAANASPWLSADDLKNQDHSTAARSK